MNKGTGQFAFRYTTFYNLGRSLFKLYYVLNWWYSGSCTKK